MLRMQADSHHDDTHVDESTQHDRSSDQPEASGASTRNLIFFALLVLIIVLPIRLYVAKPFIVSGTSMFPTFDTWHYLIIDQLSYRLDEPKRGDVIVFRYPQNPSRFFIKRIIGLPGETVTLEGTTTTITNDDHPEGFVLAEPYVDDGHQKETDMVMRLGDDEYFVMGDNRKASADSRYWGPLEEERIVGRAYVRLFPFNDIDLLPGTATYTISSDDQ